jgi:ferredoxin
METLFNFTISGKNTEIEPVKIENKNIILGIRPCDSYSYTLLENFFSFGDVKDDIFLEKRKNTVLIGMGCNSPKRTCFCTSVNLHPYRKDDVDIFLADLGKKYLVTPISDTGKTIVNKLKWLSNATKPDIAMAEKLSKQAEASITTKFDVEKTTEILAHAFNHPIWEELNESCLGCGSCTFFCPTCHCFDVIDQTDNYTGKGKRVRIWDTCQFSIYSHHTSGHNPRATGKERTRQRILHKYSYYPKNYDLIGCVGCGRCIQSCPVNRDIRTMIEKINKIKMEEVEVA